MPLNAFSYHVNKTQDVLHIYSHNNCIINNYIILKVMSLPCLITPIPTNTKSYNITSDKRKEVSLYLGYIFNANITSLP